MDDLPGIRAAVTLAASFDVRSTDPTVLRDASNLLVHLRPAPVVARIATTTASARPNVVEHFRRAVSVTEHLAGRGVPVVGPPDELPAGPFTHDGVVISFASWIPHDPTRTPTDFAAHLADLHAELHSYPDPLPNHLPLDDLAQVIAHWTRPASQLAAFTTEHDALVAQWPTLETQALHGDAHPGNLLMTPRGPVWNDFEDTWRGPIEWDLACLALTRRLDGTAAVRKYPQARDLSFHIRLRRLHAAGWLTFLERRFPECRAAADEQLEAALVPPEDRRH